MMPPKGLQEFAWRTVWIADGQPRYTESTPITKQWQWDCLDALRESAGFCSGMIWDISEIDPPAQIEAPLAAPGERLIAFSGDEAYGAVIWVADAAEDGWIHISTFEFAEDEIETTQQHTDMVECATGELQIDSGYEGFEDLLGDDYQERRVRPVLWLLRSLPMIRAA